MLNAKDIVRSELIGLMTEVTSSNNKNLIGINGKIIDETKNIIILDTKNGIKKLLKSQVKLKMKFMNRILEVDGKLLIGRPEQRIKRIRKI